MIFCNHLLADVLAMERQRDALFRAERTRPHRSRRRPRIARTFDALARRASAADPVPARAPGA
jgi:hypothetical protein